MTKLFILYTDINALDIIDVEKQMKLRAQQAQRQKETFERMKKTTLAPLPPKAVRRGDISIEDLSYKKKKQAPAVVDDGYNGTVDAYMARDWTKDFISRCKLNVDNYFKKYMVRMTVADSILVFASDNLHSQSFHSVEIMKECVAAFGFTPRTRLQQREAAYTWKYFKKFIREHRAQHQLVVFNDDVKGHKALAVVDNLFIDFTAWFLLHRLGPLILKRAELVKQQYEFSEYAAPMTNQQPNWYMLPSVSSGKEVQDACMVLYEAQKDEIVIKKKVKAPSKPRAQNDANNALSGDEFKNDDKLSGNQHGAKQYDDKLSGNQDPAGFKIDDELKTGEAVAVQYGDKLNDNQDPAGFNIDDELKSGEAGAAQYGDKLNDNPDSAGFKKDDELKSGEAEAVQHGNKLNDNQDQAGFKKDDELKTGEAGAEQRGDESNDVLSDKLNVILNEKLENLIKEKIDERLNDKNKERAADADANIIRNENEKADGFKSKQDGESILGAKVTDVYGDDNGNYNNASTAGIDMELSEDNNGYSDESEEDDFVNVN